MIKLKQNSMNVSLAMIIGVIITFTLSAFSTFANECETKNDSLLRLHILANSDSEDDQRIKYQLRDFLISDFDDIFGACTSLPEAKTAATENIELIETKSSAFLKSKGYDYEIKAEVVNEYFTTRKYNELTVPAGNYDAVRIKIGDGKGKNWWCVMFPPLCLPACTEKTKEDFFISEELSKQIEESTDIEFRFAVYEFLKRIISSSK